MSLETKYDIVLLKTDKFVLYLKLKDRERKI